MMTRLFIGCTVILALMISLTALAGTKEEAEAYFKKGEDYHNKSNNKSALECWGKSLEIYRALNDKKNVGITTRKIGNVYLNLGQFDKALFNYQAALKIAREIGDRKGEGNVLNNIGVVYDDLGQYEKALSYYEEALRIRREIGDRKGEGDTLGNIGVAYRNLGQYEKALSYYEQALKIDREVGDGQGEGVDLTYIGLVYRNLAQNDKALSYYEQALKIHKEIGYRRGEGNDLGNIGLVNQDLGQYEKALSYYERGLKIHRDTGDRKGEGKDLGNIGRVYADLDQYEKALSYHEQALKVYREVGDRKGEGNALINIGTVYHNLGQYEKALSYYEEALKIARETGDRQGEGAVLTNIGMVYSELGRDEEVLSYYERALKIKMEIGDRKGERYALSSIGVVYRERGRYMKALSYYERALKIDREIGNRKGEGDDLICIGVVYRKLGRYEEALSYYEKALKIKSEIGDVYGVYRSAWGMGKSYKALKKYSDAVSFYVASIEALESIRGELESEEFKTSFMGDKMGVYKELIELLIEMNRFEEAFNYAERARSRAFLDMLATRSLDVRGVSKKELLEKEAELRARLDELRKSETTSGDGLEKNDSPTAREAVVRKVEKEYSDLIKGFQATNPELASLVSVDAMTLDEVQKLLPADLCIVEFFTTDKNTYVFFVGKGGFSVYPVALGQKDLMKKVAELRGCLGTRNNELFTNLSRGLYDLLFSPALKDVDKKTVIVIPHGPLHYLPFSALYDGEKYLIDRYTLIVDPSASVLKYILDKRKGVKGNTIAFGNPKTGFPNLPLAETEVTEIKAIMGNADTYVEDKATETLGKEKFDGYNVIHLACHGSFNEAQPLMSSVHLARDDKNDGSLMVYELFGLDLTKSSLVVLSACDTGMSKVMTGDELIGLSRGFIFAGTPSLLATLWEVDDRSTADLMAEFYGNLKAGMTKPEALRRAQVWLKSQKGYESPYYWAPFEMIGDWQ